MKRILFCFLFILIPFESLINNPIVIIPRYISEFKFEKDSSWVLELDFNLTSHGYGPIRNTICITTSYGSSSGHVYNVNDSSMICVIYSDSLDTPLPANRRGDCIKLYFDSLTANGGKAVDSLIFGNYPYSMIDTIPSGYSICRSKSYNYYMDKSPTIGLPNDTVGACGLFRGYIYDKNNNLVTKGTFGLDNPLIIQNNGRYSTSILSGQKSLSRIADYYNSSSWSVALQTISLNVYPDSLYEQDIHLISDYVMWENNPETETDNAVKIINYPNPFNLSTNFYIKIPSSMQFTNGVINIYNVTGKIVNSIKVPKSSFARWDGNDYKGLTVSSGVYYYQVVFDKKVIKNGSMILLK